MRRRDFVFSSIAMAMAPLSGKTEPLPLIFGHRQANMVKDTGPIVFELARRIPGLSGVELQMIWKGQDLSDRETALAYKREANHWGVELPSIAGIWSKGGSIFHPGPAEDTLRRAISAAELLGASVILVALFDKNCPKMNDGSSYGPVIELLQKVSPAASAVGVTLCLETSLLPAEDKKLVDLVNRPSVKIYYDAMNVETNHPGQSVQGIEVLNHDIMQCHLKNETRLLEETGKVNWAAALKAYKKIGCQGWYVFETEHASPEQCIEATRKNIEFVTRCLA